MRSLIAANCAANTPAIVCRDSGGFSKKRGLVPSGHCGGLRHRDWIKLSSILPTRAAPGPARRAVFGNCGPSFFESGAERHSTGACLLASRLTNRSSRMPTAAFFVSCFACGLGLSSSWFCWPGIGLAQALAACFEMNNNLETGR